MLIFKRNKLNDYIKMQEKGQAEKYFWYKSNKRYHHNTPEEGTREADTVLCETKILSNDVETNWPLPITFKDLKVNVNTFSCYVFIEYCHNHALNSLETLSFKMLSIDWNWSTVFFWFNTFTSLQLIFSKSIK